MPAATRGWSLQTRLIITVVSFVALILVAVGFATGAILRSIMVESLDAQITTASNRIPIAPGDSAEDVLTTSKQKAGTLLILTSSGSPTGAYVASDGDVHTLSEAQLTRVAAELATQLPNTDPAGARLWATVSVPGLGEYRVLTVIRPTGFSGALGLSTSEVTGVIARILTTVALVTTGGLLVLAAAVAMVIRRSLAPLRSVAATATRVAAQPLASGDVRITERVPTTSANAADEIGRVGAALNTLLDHVDTSLSARQRNEERMRAFVADASHELRTPLAAIRGYSELSLRTLSQIDEGADRSTWEAGAHRSEQGLERIHAASLRMTTLVEDLLLLARLDEGQELVYGAVDLTRVVVDAVTDAQVAGPDHDWELDAAEEPVVVAGDAVRLHQVVANLLANARVHTPAGTRVRVGITTTDGTAIVRVADNGPGIDPSVAGELFERFARADGSRARHTGGTGLGLSIAQAIVHAHHGTLTVTSVPGDTTFEVRLPARPPVPAAVDV